MLHVGGGGGDSIACAGVYQRTAHTPIRPYTQASLSRNPRGYSYQRLQSLACGSWRAPTVGTDYCMVLKSTEQTHLTALPLATLLAEGSFPRGV